jgi:hypothetical protein
LQFFGSLNGITPIRDFGDNLPSCCSGDYRAKESAKRILIIYDENVDSAETHAHNGSSPEELTEPLQQDSS